MIPAVALLGLLFCADSHALDPRLHGSFLDEPSSWRGLALSMGPGHPVCARATFDRRKAAAGGMVLLLDTADASDDEAVRMSEALVVRRGGLAGSAALAARRHGVPAVALAAGVCDGAKPSWTLLEPAFSAPSRQEGVPARAASGTRERVIVEGAAVCVDPVSARVSLPAPEESAARVEAAEAARAYDGLRDAGALERWLGSEAAGSRAHALMSELVPRAFTGGIERDDFARLVRACRAEASSAGRQSLARIERRAFSRAERALRAELSSCPESAADAPSLSALDHIEASARLGAERAAWAGRVLGLEAKSVGSLARECSRACERRRKSVPEESPSFAAVARAAGADSPVFTPLPKGSWSSFMAENGLADFLETTVSDASLGLNRKSARLRERILASPLDPASGAARAAMSAADGPVLVVGEDSSVSAGPGDVLEKVRQVWADSWAPGPLGARLRAGRGLAYEGRVRIEKSPAVEVSGLVFSRDPGSGRRGRTIIEAAGGRWELDPRTGRVLSREGSDPSAMSPARLRRLARAARAFDAWLGKAAEVSFAFAADKLLVLSARGLESPALPHPVSGAR